MVNFKLIGYFNQEINFPCIVLPIIENKKNTKTYIVTYDHEYQTRLNEISKSFQFSRCQSRDFFNPYLTKLFALNASIIKEYNTNSEQLFFRLLLLNQRFSKRNPFLRLEITSEYRDIKLSLQEWCKCHLVLKNQKLLSAFEIRKSEFRRSCKYSDKKREKLEISSPEWLRQSIRNWNNDGNTFWKSIWTILFYMGYDEDIIQETILFVLNNKLNVIEYSFDAIVTQAEKLEFENWVTRRKIVSLNNFSE